MLEQDYTMQTKCRCGGISWNKLQLQQEVVVRAVDQTTAICQVHTGPFCHHDDDISVEAVIPLVNKSAGFSRVGQYLHSVGSVDCISVMQ